MVNLRRVLEGVQVLDFTQIGAGPTCTMLLADLGARVIKVEPLGGELGRKLGPAWIGEDAALFHGFNRNKKSIALDLKSPEGIVVARKLIMQSKVLVESMRPGVMERLGVGVCEMKAVNPELIWCSVSAYGQTGPYANRAGVDGILQADSGLMSLIGFQDTGPAKVQTPVVDVFTGYVAALGVLAALLVRPTGSIPPLDVSLFSSAIALQQAALTSYLVDLQPPKKQGSAAPYSAPNEAFETADGWIMVAAYNAGRWERLCECLGQPELADDPRFRTSSMRVSNRVAMIGAITPLFRQQTTDRWLEVLEIADILCAPVTTYDRLTRHPQLVETDLLAAVEDPRHGLLRMPDFPIRVQDQSAPPPRPAPMVGENSREILIEAGYSAREIRELIEAGVVGATESDLQLLQQGNVR